MRKHSEGSPFHNVVRPFHTGGFTVTATPEASNKLQQMQALQQLSLPPWFSNEEWVEVQAIILKYDNGGAVEAFLERRYADARKLMSKYFDEPRESVLMNQYMVGVRLNNHR